MDIRKYFKVIPKDNEDTSIVNNNFIKPIIKTYEVFVDGSTFNNGRSNSKGGIGIFFADNDSKNVSSEIKFKKVTNNICELKACIEAIKIIVNKEQSNENFFKILIYSDSQYTINSIVNWASMWKFNDWKRKVTKNKFVDIKNKGLIKELHDMYNKYNIRFKHVKAH